jgi:hypothetical protein
VRLFIINGFNIQSLVGCREAHDLRYLQHAGRLGLDLSTGITLSTAYEYVVFRRCNVAEFIVDVFVVVVIGAAGTFAYICTFPTTAGELVRDSFPHRRIGNECGYSRLTNVG